ncbi:MAG TPA: Fur family transcriptional regulator [Levilinea sp.]|nr:Fur family transcriptional regulator [Levilinea sp.]
MEPSLIVIRNKLVERGIRPSYQRIKVLEYLFHAGGHPTVEDIYAQLSPLIPSLSKATIYNTLRSFMNGGLIRVISIDGVEKRYDLTIYNHGHFKCDHCGEIFNFHIDIDNFPLDDLAQFEIREKNLYIHGLCPHCLRKGESELL